MRSAGCTINDLWDQDFDKRVERTKARPLASGALTTTQALGFLAAQLTCGLGVLLQFNMSSIYMGFAAMPLVVAYPLMKRVTYFPQLVLGLAFNWGVLVGWTAVQGSLSIMAVPLYFSGVCWTLVYDTLYGYQDRSDDLKIGQYDAIYACDNQMLLSFYLFRLCTGLVGVKSTSIYFGDSPQLVLSGLTLGTVSGLLLTGLAADLSSPFYVGTAAVGAHMLWQVWTADLNSPANLWFRFQSNALVGGAIAVAIIAGHF
jgi:4-hydroxybenzoate polyprenyltransferase